MIDSAPRMRMRILFIMLFSLCQIRVGDAAHLSFPLASMIQFPPVAKSDSYKDLVCTEQDKSNIFEIISTMAEYGKLSLLMKQSYLKRLGAQIDHVHPLKFLSTILTDPHLKQCLNEIFDDYFKRNGFMDGVGPSLTRQAEKGKLTQYIAEFAAEVGIPPERIAKFFQTQDWEGLVRFLMQN